MKKVFKSEKGFTLIELMIVIAILGILAAVAIPNFLNARGKAQDASALSTLEAIKTSMEMYAADNGTYPTGSVATVAGLSTALGDDWPSNVKTDGTTGSIVAPSSGTITNAGGSAYIIWAIGRDSTHCYSLTQNGTKTGPEALGAGL
ncbi:MAG: prepilin-type N-terminal cleavage/methylation domain-containing protein [bacterium]